MAHWSDRLAYLNNARLIKEPVSKCKTKQSETRHTKVMGTKEWKIGYILASSFTYMNIHTDTHTHTSASLLFQLASMQYKVMSRQYLYTLCHI